MNRETFEDHLLNCRYCEVLRILFEMATPIIDEKTIRAEVAYDAIEDIKTVIKKGRGANLHVLQTRCREIACVKLGLIMADPEIDFVQRFTLLMGLLGIAYGVVDGNVMHERCKKLYDELVDLSPGGIAE